MKGCPLNCPWCHNPESKSPGRQISYIAEYCINCGACNVVCPITSAANVTTDRSKSRSSAARDSDKVNPEIDRNHCTVCGNCVEACPTAARRLIGEEITPGQLLARVERDRPFHDQSGGGITFSGGEPLFQPRWLIECLMRCRQTQWHTVVDTCGFAPADLIAEVAPLTDLFLYDLKLVDDGAHRHFTGRSVKPILANLRTIDSLDIPTWIRIPLIPGVNDDRETLDTIGRFISSLSRVNRVHLLPYHQIGSHKHQRLGQTDQSDQPVAPPDVADKGPGEVGQRLSFESAVKLLNQFELDVIEGG